MSQQNPENVQTNGRTVEYRNFLGSKRRSQKVQDLLAARAVKSDTPAGKFAKALGLNLEQIDKQQGESDVSTNRS